ncbi:peroxiredoxin family protein [Terriglobus sp.]|uniref:peroxiredoxin family protein n=1 Tax=Terriglobus sp. TaxID=1889013 RepID=UPI003B00CB22
MPFESAGATRALQPRLDEITQSTRRLVQPERLLASERLIAELLATGIENRMLPVGTEMPGFALPDSASGRIVNSADLLALGPLIISFFRGRWDPYCVTELETWRDLYPDVRRRRALLVAISPQTLRQGDFTVQQHGLPFPLLRDADCEAAERFGVAYDVTSEMDRYYRSILVSLPYINSGRNVMETAAGDAGRLPLPATFLVDQQGSIRFAEGHADHRVRPEPQDILALL